MYCINIFIELAPMAPFTIGMAVSAGHFAAQGLTGASLNPARSLASAIFADYWDDLWIFIAGPICGGIVGAWLYVLVFEKGEVKGSVDE